MARFLWERTSIIDDYVTKTKLPAEHKEILLGWKRCIPGTFIIERHLKKGSVFISTNNNSVYLVNGIIDSWEEMLPNYPTPLIVVVAKIKREKSRNKTQETAKSFNKTAIHVENPAFLVKKLKEGVGNPTPHF